MPQVVALEHLDVVVRPGERLEDVTVLIRDGMIVAVGADIPIPEGAERHDHSGHTAYAGLIDAYSEAVVADPVAGAGAPYWNANVIPQRQAAATTTAVADAAKLRGQGITLRLVAPAGGIVRGSSGLFLVSDADSNETLVRDNVWQHLALTVPRGRGQASRDAYPNSPMGAMALLRQAMLDARWYEEAQRAAATDRKLPRPETNLALATLATAMQQQVFVIDAPNERMALRGVGIAKEFSLQSILRGSGREYRDLEAIVKSGLPLLIPVDFPDAPKITDAVSARETSLTELMDWEFAPTNPSRLAAAGAEFCLTTDGLEDVGLFLKQVRQAVSRGLSVDHALAAVTTTPAKLLGVEDLAGTVESGRWANLVITDGDLFAEKTKTIETWVAGRRYEVTDVDRTAIDSIVGKWTITLRGVPQADGVHNLVLELTAKEKELKGKLTFGDKTTDLTKLERGRDLLAAKVDLSKLDAVFPAGTSWLEWITVGDGAEATVVSAKLTLPDQQVVTLEVARQAEQPEEESPPEQAEAAAEEAESKTSETTDANPADANSTENTAPENTAPENTASAEPAKGEVVSVELTRPLGDYGLVAAPEQLPLVLFKGATVWTSGPAGILEGADVLVRDGKIEQVGVGISIPEGCHIIDATGKHISPGLIDCHSHMATDGGVNESGQTITAEVRVADFIDNSDISIYRQLAGGLTIANVLHGSANPIGGQNQVIKLRWGASMEEMRFAGAPAGIKFALGENVKRTRGRYPDTRMGVEQIIRDQLLAAREYAEAHRAYRAGQRNGLPPRMDLQMEALAQVVEGTRWIHCHSYRQDEIVALLDVLDEFGIRIGSLQHILEGYKVADRIREHGGTASSFSDWWAYKVEVYDAIPHNGAIMHDEGIVVSFNSDDAELARHMNTEAGKAMKYGNVPAAEALKFVTLNPAKQLRIDDRVGSLEVGKDADLVIWSGPPLSTLSRCEQTWVDGRCYFSLEQDATLRARDSAWHAALVQKVLNGGSAGRGARQARVEEEDRWHRHDIYCGHGGHGHDHDAEHEHEHELEAAALHLNEEGA